MPKALQNNVWLLMHFVGLEAFDPVCYEILVFLIIFLQIFVCKKLLKYIMLLYYPYFRPAGLEEEWGGGGSIFNDIIWDQPLFSFLNSQIGIFSSLSTVLTLNIEFGANPQNKSQEHKKIPIK